MNERGNDIEQNEHTIKTKTSKKARLESKRDFLRRSKVIFKPIINQYLGKLKDGKEYWSIEFESQQEHEQNMEVNTESRMGKDKEVHQQTSNNRAMKSFDGKEETSLSTDEIG